MDDRFIGLYNNRYQTKEELEKLREELNQYRDHLYVELKKVNQHRVYLENELGHLAERERYFRKQEQRLSVVAIVAISFLMIWFAYLKLGIARFGSIVWFSAIGVLGLFLIVNLALYLLDKFRIKKAAGKAALQTLIHFFKLPLYFLQIIRWLMKAVFMKLFQRQRAANYRHPI